MVALRNVLPFSICIVMVVVGTLICLSNSLPSTRNNDGTFKINVVHMNDFHARFDETNNEGGTCKSDGCIGGFSRLYEEITNRLRATPDSILLNAGDNFQGTLWYSLFKWNVTQYFLNRLPFDAYVLGNHEFDDGIEGVVPFIKSLKGPVVVSNIDDSNEPSIQNLYKNSVVIERDGKKIGIIGVIISSTNLISDTGKLRFYPESASVNAEAERLVKEEGVFTNIVLSHCGYDLEQEIAKNATGKIGLVVGGHSHTFLDSEKPSVGPDVPYGPYPTIVKRDSDGKSVLVVQASAYSKYIGEISINYDNNGDVIDWKGNPIFLDHNLAQDNQINTLLEPWRKEVEAVGNQVLGQSLVLLSRSNCYTSECNLGNFITDAYVDSFTRTEGDAWTYAAIAITNAGSLRTSIERGNITYNDISNCQPFGNTVDVGEIEGKYIKEMFEYTMRTPYSYGREHVDISLLQVSGLHVEFDVTKEEGQRVTSIKARCNDCQIPIYEDLVLNKTYRIITPSYLTAGGDGFTMLSNNLKNVVTGQLDMDVYRNYLKKRSPVFAEVGNRMVIKGAQKIKARRLEM